MNDFSDVPTEQLERWRDMIEKDIKLISIDWHEVVPQWRRELLLIEQELTRR